MLYSTYTYICTDTHLTCAMIHELSSHPNNGLDLSSPATLRRNARMQDAVQAGGLTQPALEDDTT